MSAEAKQNIDPLRQSAVAAAGYVFPWEPGGAMYYGSLGVHSNGFSSAGYGSWLAVDFLSDGNTGAGHAPNRLLAASAGSISYICNDGTSVAIRAGDFMYTHILWNSRVQYGYTFSQGSEIGQLKTGSFNDICGYASQGSEWFHVHWGFPNTGYLTVESWVLNMSSEQWGRGEESLEPGSWFTASATPGPVVYDDHDINDDNIYDSAGDGDGIVECGETIEMHVDLRNQGSGPVLNANMTLSENDPYITFPLVNSSSAYPTISGGGTATNSDDFDFAVAAGTPDGHTITFNLYVTSTSGGPWSDTFTVPVSCADPFSEMLTGSDFEAFAPNYWRGLDLRGGIDGPDCDIAHSGECSAAFLGDGALRQLRYVGAVNGNAGDTLEFSLWARSVNATPPFFAKLVLYNTADGATQSVRIIPGRGSRPWTYFTTGPFTATSAYDRVRVYLLYGGDSNSKVWYDDISLRIDSTERIRDGEFEIFTPTGWTALNLTAAVDGPDCDTAHSQNCSAVIVGDGSLKQYRYVSAVSGSAGDTLEFSLWSRSQNASAPFFAKLVLYNTADGSTQDVRIVPAQGSQSWTHYMTGIFTAAIDYDRVRVYLLYGDDSGLVWYDDISLLRR